jgi:electron transfer flavoprotein alpha subunit
MVTSAGKIRVAVLVKQVPRFDAMELGPDGRMQRDGLEVELNPYCRRAVSKGVELARARGTTCTVFTLGPPTAEDVLREAVAWGADDAVLITDPQFAGSDTLATARALAAALRREGPFDIVLAGRNSVDADTGQVGPEVAELLDFAFLGGARTLQFDGDTVEARCEHDDGWVIARARLPVLVSCAERLCEPAKVDPAGRDLVSADRIRTLDARALGPGPWGSAGSPTSVGDVRLLDVERSRTILSGPVADQVHDAVGLLVERGALIRATGVDPMLETVARSNPVAGARIAVLLEGDRPREAREVLGTAARLARDIDGIVVAVGVGARSGTNEELASWGADELVTLTGSAVAEDVARALADWCAPRPPWALLASGTMWGREVASRIAARMGVGLTGDAVDVSVEDARVVAWKPAFGGRLVAAIHSDSAVQLATVRPGILALYSPRSVTALRTTVLTVEPRGRVEHLNGARDDDLDDLARAEVVVGVGTGVEPSEYDDLRPLLIELSAEIAATRKVTDRGWLPRSRQVGVTGRSISPRLYVAIGLSGKFNHMVGVRGAGVILAVNPDPGAAVFESSDVGIVAAWQEVVPLLLAEIEGRRAAETDQRAGSSVAMFEPPFGVGKGY